MSKKHPRTNFCVPTCLHALTGLSKKRFARLFYDLRDPWWARSFRGFYHVIKYLRSKGYEAFLDEYTPTALTKASPLVVLINDNHAVVAKHCYGNYAIVKDTTLEFTLNNPKHIFYIRKMNLK